MVALTLEGIEGKANYRYHGKIQKCQLCWLCRCQTGCYDYEAGISTKLLTGVKTAIDLPRSNVLKFIFDDYSWFALPATLGDELAEDLFLGNWKNRGRGYRERTAEKAGNRFNLSFDCIEMIVKKY